LRYKLKGLK